MSTLRISNIEAKSVPASATVDEKVKITNSSGDVLVFLDGKTSGITTVGINTTDGNITFDANSNVVVTGIITATKFVGAFEPTDLPVSGDLSIADKIIHIGDTNTAIRFPAADTITAETGGSERLRITSAGAVGINTDVSGNGGGAKLVVGGRIQSNAGGYWFTGGNGAEDGWHVQDSGGNFVVVESGVAERLRIDANGDLNLNTTTNQYGYRLNIQDSAIIYAQTASSGGTEAKWNLDSSDNNMTFGTVTSSDLRLVTANNERLRIESSVHLHTGYTSSFGSDHLCILASDGGGVAIASNNVGNANSGDFLGSLSFQGYHSGANYSSAEARISGVAAANHTGSSAATDMVFYTKPSTTGPGSAPTERFRITANGNLNWRNGTVRQRKHGAFLGISGAGTSDVKISGNFEANDMIRVRWAYNWNAGDGGAWGEAVIWKQYESTKRVRYLTDVKANPLTSVSFPHSGNDIWLRWQTNAGINGWYMIDVECHGCDPFPF